MGSAAMPNMPMVSDRSIRALRRRLLEDAFLEKTDRARLQVFIAAAVPIIWQLGLAGERGADGRLTLKLFDIELHGSSFWIALVLAITVIFTFSRWALFAWRDDRLWRIATSEKVDKIREETDQWLRALINEQQQKEVSHETKRQACQILEMRRDGLYEQLRDHWADQGEELSSDQVNEIMRARDETEKEIDAIRALLSESADAAAADFEKTRSYRSRDPFDAILDEANRYHDAYMFLEVACTCLLCWASIVALAKGFATIAQF